MGTGLVGEVRASTGTPCVPAKVAGVANLAPSKKPSMGVPMEVESSLAVGRYIEKG